MLVLKFYYESALKKFGLLDFNKEINFLDGLHINVDYVENSDYCKLILEIKE